MSDDNIARLMELSDSMLDIDPDIFRQIIDSLPSAVLIVDASGKILLVNKQLELLFGYHRSQLLGQNFDVLIPEENRDAHKSHFSFYMKEPTVRPMNPTNHFSGRRADGTGVQLQISLGPLISAHGIWVMASIRKRTDA